MPNNDEEQLKARHAAAFFRIYSELIALAVDGYESLRVPALMWLEMAAKRGNDEAKRELQKDKS